MNRDDDKFDAELKELWSAGTEPAEYEVLAKAVRSAEHVAVPDELGRRLRSLAHGQQERRGVFFLPSGPLAAGVLVMGFALFLIVRPFGDGSLGSQSGTPLEVTEEALEWTAEDLFLGSGSSNLFTMEDVL